MDGEIGREELVRERLSRNGLSGGFDSPEGCCSSLLGVQAQVPRYASLSIFNRIPGLTSGDLDRSFSERSIVARWGQRRTLRLYSAADSGLVCRPFHARNHLDGPRGMRYGGIVSPERCAPSSGACLHPVPFIAPIRSKGA